MGWILILFGTVLSELKISHRLQSIWILLSTNFDVGIGHWKYETGRIRKMIFVKGKLPFICESSFLLNSSEQWLKRAFQILIKESKDSVFIIIPANLDFFNLLWKWISNLIIEEDEKLRGLSLLLLLILSLSTKTYCIKSQSNKDTKWSCLVCLTCITMQ